MLWETLRDLAIFRKEINKLLAFKQLLNTEIKQ